MSPSILSRTANQSIVAIEFFERAEGDSVKMEPHIVVSLAATRRSRARRTVWESLTGGYESPYRRNVGIHLVRLDRTEAPACKSKSRKDPCDGSSRQNLLRDYLSVAELQRQGRDFTPSPHP